MTFPAAPGLRRIDQEPCPSVHCCSPGLFGSPEGVLFSPKARYGFYPFLRLAKTLPILMRVSATTPNPTQRSIPSSPRYRLRFSPCRRLSTLIRPSQPVLHFCPLR